MRKRVLWVLCSVVALTPLSGVASAHERQSPAPLGLEDALAPEGPTEARLNRIQPPDQVLEAAGLQAGMVVGEIGAGRGRYSVQIAVGIVHPRGRASGDAQEGDEGEVR